MALESSRRRMIAKALGPGCILIVCGLLALGLWPFHSPKNAVTWLDHQNGLRFKGPGTVWSEGSFQMAESSQNASSLEVWMEPARVDASSTILGFSTWENPLQLTLQQYHSSLILKRQTGRARPMVIGILQAFRRRQAVFVAITSGPEQSVIYLDGRSPTPLRGFRLDKDFTGQLVFGTSPIEEDSWEGRLLGLAVYSSELSAQRVAAHQRSWTTRGQPDLAPEDRAVALFLFNERAGSLIHNAVPSGIPLYIPTRFGLLHQIFLKPFWTEYRPDWTYVKDVLINIIGFVPLGLALRAYWTLVRPIKRPALVTTALGLAVSLTIELVQSLIPTRNSGTTDLFTNSFGTYLGFLLYASAPVQALLARLYGSSSERGIY